MIPFRPQLFLAVALAGISVLAETPPSGNSAVVPAGRLERDFYDWEKRHQAVMAVKDALHPDLVFIGDSITHFFAGEPNEPSRNRGAEAMKFLAGGRPVLNLGFGWDRTQNVLRRLELGELDGVSPRAVVIHIGTNNLAGTPNARANTPAEIAEAVGVILDRVREKCPAAKIILMAVFPRGEKPDNPMRAQIAAINQALAKYAGRPNVALLDITAKLTNPDGTISREVMPDFLHPSARGYAIWAEALKPLLP